MIAVNGLTLDVGDYVVLAPALTVEIVDVQITASDGSGGSIGTECDNGILRGRIDSDGAVISLRAELRAHLRPSRAASRIDVIFLVIGRTVRKFGAVVVNGVDLAIGIGRNADVRSVDQRILRVVGELRAGGHVRAVERSNHTGLHFVCIHAREEEVRRVVLRGDAHGKFTVLQSVVVVDENPTHR